MELRRCHVLLGLLRTKQLASYARPDLHVLILLYRRHFVPLVITRMDGLGPMRAPHVQRGIFAANPDSHRRDAPPVHIAFQLTWRAGLPPVGIHPPTQHSRLVYALLGFTPAQERRGVLAVLQVMLARGVVQRRTRRRNPSTRVLPDVIPPEGRHSAQDVLLGTPAQIRRRQSLFRARMALGQATIRHLAQFARPVGHAQRMTDLRTIDAVMAHGLPSVHKNARHAPLASRVPCSTDRLICRASQAGFPRQGQ